MHESDTQSTEPFCNPTPKEDEKTTTARKISARRNSQPTPPTNMDSDKNGINTITMHSVPRKSSLSSQSTNSRFSPPVYRIARACDRCRSKKIRCDGKRPQCSQCASVGFECKISDKLQRKAFPRGYTETLEERVRELEAENRRLVALCNLKEQQFQTMNSNRREESILNSGNLSTIEQSDGSVNDIKDRKIPIAMDSPYLNTSYSRFNITDDKLNILDSNIHSLSQISGHVENEMKSNMHGNDGLCNEKTCRHEHNLINPVATSTSDSNGISFEQNEAPGLPAVKALESVNKYEENTQLVLLVSLSLPRSTEEILFIPQLLARIKDTYGFNSKHCLYTVSLLASLKNVLPPPSPHRAKINSAPSNRRNSRLAEDDDDIDQKNIEDITRIDISTFDDLTDLTSRFFRFNFDNQKPTTMNGTGPLLSANEIEELIKLYYTYWAPHIPVVDRDNFYTYYNQYRKDVSKLERDKVLNNGAAEEFDSNQEYENYQSRIKSLSYKVFSCILCAMCLMGLVTKRKHDYMSDIKEELTDAQKEHTLIAYYHQIITNIWRNPFFGMSTTTIQTLQLFSLIMFYSINTGDVLGTYEMRGRVASMAQQLRLHRCPSAVLAGAGSKMSEFEQGERRILFWGIYSLDVFSSLQLGVPRLIKDHEIECALPVSAEDMNIQDIGPSRQGYAIQLQGHVSVFSLEMLRFSKILGNILDLLFKRNTMTEKATRDVALMHENVLDIWRSRLPDIYSFKLDVNGSIDMHGNLSNLETSTVSTQELERRMLMAFYFLAKSIILLHVTAANPIQPMKGPADQYQSNEAVKLEDSQPTSKISLSYSILQQAVNTMLNIFESVRNFYLTLPINMSYTKARYSVLSVRGSLNYIKGGVLFSENKSLLLDIIKDIEIERKLDLPGVLPWHSLKLLDMTITLLLQAPNTKIEKLDKLLLKKLNYYNKLSGVPLIKTKGYKKRGPKRKIPFPEDEMNGEKKSKHSFSSNETDSTTVNDFELRETEGSTTNFDEGLDEFSPPKKSDSSILNHGKSDSGGIIPNSFSNTDLSAIFNMDTSNLKLFLGQDNQNDAQNGREPISYNNSSSVLNTIMAAPNANDTSIGNVTNNYGSQDNGGLTSNLFGPSQSSQNLSKLMVLLNSDNAIASNKADNFEESKTSFSLNDALNPSNNEDKKSLNKGPDSMKNSISNLDSLFQSNYNFVFDASLGLAPIFFERPEVNADIIDANSTNSLNDPKKQDTHLKNRSLPSTSTNATNYDLDLQANATLTGDPDYISPHTANLPPSITSTDTSLQKETKIDGVIPRMEHRRPRRYHDQVTSNLTLDGNENRCQDNLHDLFQWQNSS